MATLYEYFVKDSSRDLTLHETWKYANPDGSLAVEIVAKLHYDFPACAKFVSFYIPISEHVVLPEVFALNRLDEVLSWTETGTEVSAGLAGEMASSRDLVFTGRVYLYSERPVPADHRERILTEANAKGHKLIFRSVEYASERSRWEKPKAFISHDSRDKSEIAQVLAVQLQKMLCTVWYDEYSLNVGDSLRGGIENGLKECERCVLILTPNFLSNSGWTRREYDSIFTRELVEKQNVILPVWHQVSAADVYRYSPILADRVAAQWADGVEIVARKLMAAIDSGAR